MKNSMNDKSLLDENIDRMFPSSNEPDWFDDDDEERQIDNDSIEENISNCPFGLKWDVDSIGNMIATPNQNFWDAWRSNKVSLKTQGYKIFKTRPRFGNGADVWQVSKSA